MTQEKAAARPKASAKAQELLVRAALATYEQGAPCLMDEQEDPGDVTCAYHDPFGKRCAFGHMLPESLAQELADEECYYHDEGARPILQDDLFGDQYHVWIARKRNPVTMDVIARVRKYLYGSQNPLRDDDPVLEAALALQHAHDTSRHAMGDPKAFRDSFRKRLEANLATTTSHSWDPIPWPENLS